MRKKIIKRKVKKDEPVKTEIREDFCLHCGMQRATIISLQGHRYCCLACQTNHGD